MTSPPPPVSPAPDPAPVPRPAATRAIEALLRTLTKGLRAVQLYLPNNPMYEQATVQLAEGFRAVWRECDGVTLEIHDTEIRTGDSPVYQSDNKADSLAWFLYKDGLRSLTFRPGVEDDEVVRFLTILNRVRTLPPDSEDDLLTLLWEQDFERIQYAVHEAAEDDEQALEGEARPASTDATRHAVQQAVDEETSDDFVSPEDPDSSLYELVPEEVAYLERELHREYAQDMRANVTAVLYDILEVQTDAEVRTEVVEILTHFLEHLIATGDIRAVIYLLRESVVVRERVKALAPSHADGLGELPLVLSQPETFARFITGLETVDANLDDADLEQLLAQLRPDVFTHGLRSLGTVREERVRDLLEDALLKMAIANPPVLAAALGASDSDILRMAVRFVRTLAVADLVPLLGKRMQRAPEPVRAEIVDALDAIGSREALVELTQALDDPAREIRVAAVRILADHGQTAILPQLADKLADREFRNVELTEKMAFFEAYGMLAGPDGVAYLAPMFLPAKGFMKRKGDPEIRACAAMALGKIGTPEARALLHEAEEDKEPLVRTAIGRALRDGAEP